MNPNLILWSIKDLIVDNEAALTNGLESSGEPKTIEQISTSRHTRMRGRIFVGILCSTAVETYDASRISNAVAYSYVVDQTPNVRYTIEIDVADYAEAQAGEEFGGDYEEFEKDATTFWTFVSRLVRLFRTNTAIPAHSGSFTIEVYGDGTAEDRRIQIDDLSVIYEDATGARRTQLYAGLKFDVQTCGEPDPLA